MGAAGSASRRAGGSADPARSADDPVRGRRDHDRPLKEGRVRVPLPAGTYQGRILARKLDWFPGSPAAFASMDLAQPFVVRGGATLELHGALDAHGAVLRSGPPARGRRARGLEDLAAARRRQGRTGPPVDGHAGAGPRCVASRWNESSIRTSSRPTPTCFASTPDGYLPWHRDVQLVHGRLEHVDVDSNARRSGCRTRAPLAD